MGRLDSSCKYKHEVGCGVFFGSPMVSSGTEGEYEQWAITEEDLMKRRLLLGHMSSPDSAVTLKSSGDQTSTHL